MAAAGGRQRPNFVVQRLSEIEGEAPRIVVMGVGAGIHDRQRAGHGDLDRPGGGGLGDGEVAIEEVLAARLNPAGDRGQFGLVGPVPNRERGQVLEVESPEMAAMVVDVVFAPLLAIRGYVDAAGHLFGMTAASVARR